MKNLKIHPARGGIKKQNIKGKISTTAKGAGYIDMSDKKIRSIYFESGNLNTALNGDVVEAIVTRKNIRGEVQDVGKVIKIISRARDTFVGTITLESLNTQKRFIFIPDDRRVYTNFSLLNDSSGLLREGQKVQMKMSRWLDPNKLPEGKVLKILGMKGDNDVEMESIVLDKGFDTNFPFEVEREAEVIGHNKDLMKQDILRRRDMRDVLTFTIDPFDAKDFDDAISFRVIEDKTALYEIGIHIADVSHYVRPGTALDKEALKRGCSVYLVDRTIPMLPEVLSNDVCSLKPNEDKLTFSAIFRINEKAKIVDRWFGKTIIRSDFRFTYETAQAVIDGEPSRVIEYSSHIQETSSAEIGMKYNKELVTLNKIAKILQKDKFAKGAIEFEQTEVKFKLDNNGKPVGVYAKPRLDTHKLVEEYMLLANREVARYIFDSIRRKGKKDTGSVYRIHDVPDKDKIRELADFVKALGYTLKVEKDGTVKAHDLNNLLDQIDGTPHESLIRTATIRSMQKAIYSTVNVGHFGLAFDYYTHFTSPIRRYPDLLVHRILAKHLHGESFGDRDIHIFQKIAESSTEREIDASEAERTSRKLKQVEYMSERIGKVFQGTISGVTKWGIYVEEDESKSEGMIPIRNIGDDYFIFNENTYSIVGEKTKKRYTLGDKIKFRVLSADVDKRQLEYSLVQ